MFPTAFNLARLPFAKPAVLLLALAAVIAVPSRADAYLIRVSFKFILSSSGVRPGPNLSTNAQVNTQELIGNWLLCNSSSAYRIDVAEIVNVANRGGYFNFPCSAGALETVAQNDGAFAWRSNMINVYVTNNSCAGQCSFPSSGKTIVLGQGASASTLVHEIGHYMGLLHTHETGGDGISDTLIDNASWTTKNQMAIGNYFKLYSQLTSSQKALVDQTFGNVMSYHIANRWKLTPLQNVRFHSNAVIYRSTVVNWSHQVGNSGSCSFILPLIAAEDPNGVPELPEVPEDGVSLVPDGLKVVFRHGDANGDDATDISDAMAVLSWLFRGGAPLVCADAADVNDDGSVRMDDAVMILMALYQDAPTGRSVPINEPTVDLDEDDLDCQLEMERWFAI